MNLWDLDEDTVAVYRQGVELVLEQLGKQLKEIDKAPRLAHAERMRKLVTEQVAVATDAGRLLLDQADLEAEAGVYGRRYRHDPAQEANTISADEAAREAEKEAKALRRRRTIAALRLLRPEGVDAELVAQLQGEDEEARTAARARFVELLTAQIENTEYQDGEGKAWPGLFLFEEQGDADADGEPVVLASYWCIVHADPFAFYFNVQAPDAFNALEATPDIKGEELVDALLGAILEPPAAQPEEPLTVYMNAAGTTTTDPETETNYAVDFAIAEGYRIVPNGEWAGAYRRREDDSFEWRELPEEEAPPAAEDEQDGPFPVRAEDAGEAAAEAVPEPVAKPAKQSHVEEPSSADAGAEPATDESDVADITEHREKKRGSSKARSKAPVR